MNTGRQTRLVVFVATVALAVARLAFAQAGPPAARVQPVTETLHGVAVTDPYRWMEAGGQELTDWMTAQDVYTRALLERIPGRTQLLAELRALNTDAAQVTRARRASSRYLYLKRSAGDRVAKLYVRGATGGPERLLVDPATLGDGRRRFTVGDFAASNDGRYVAFSAAPDGNETGILRIIEIATARSLPDAVDRVLYLNSWLGPV